MYEAVGYASVTGTGTSTVLFVAVSAAPLTLTVVMLLFALATQSEPSYVNMSPCDGDGGASILPATAPETVPISLAISSSASPTLVACKDAFVYEISSASTSGINSSLILLVTLLFESTITHGS